MSEYQTSRDRLGKYCTGNGLDIGSGGGAINKTAICIDKVKVGHAWIGSDPIHLVGDARYLLWFTDCSLDYVYSSHCLEDFEDTAGTLKEWCRVVKKGGYVVLFLPDQKAYENHVSKHGGIPNLEHKHANFSLHFVKCLLPDNVIIEHEMYPVPNNVYSFDLVLRKV